MAFTSINLEITDNYLNNLRLIVSELDCSLISQGNGDRLLPALKLSTANLPVSLCLLFNFDRFGLSVSVENVLIYVYELMD